LSLALACVLGDGVNIVAEFSGTLIAGSADFLNDRVFSHCYINSFPQ
jgi:hypothetical protein